MKGAQRLGATAVQIVVGLLVDRDGFPLEIYCFEGNKAVTLIPVLKSFQVRRRIRTWSWGPMQGCSAQRTSTPWRTPGSASSLAHVSPRPPTTSRCISSATGNHFGDGKTLESARSMGTCSGARDRHVVYLYSFKPKKRDNYTLNKQIEKAEKVANGIRTLKRDRFVKLAGRNRAWTGAWSNGPARCSA